MRAPRLGHVSLRSSKSCRLNGVDPEAYLADVLEKLVNGWPAARIDELLPWAQAYAKPAANAPEIKIAA